jgi:hypothetical protein
MASFTVNIPNSKIAFFKSLLENLGFTYEEVSQKDYAISEEQKLILEERITEYEQALNANKKVEDVIKNLQNKHGLHD